MRQTELQMSSRSRQVIEPYHACPAGRFHLVHGDAVATMAKIPDRSVDLVFSDPPYFLSDGGSTCSGGERVAVDKGAWDESRGLAADHAFHRSWLEQVREVLKPSGTVWVSGTHHCIFSIGYAMQALGFHILNLVTWSKPNASPNLGCRQFTHSSEMLIWAAPREYQPLRHTFNYELMKALAGGKQMRDHWSIPVTPAREKKLGHHSCQKPEALLERIIAASSLPGQLVLDPFCGSGTSGLVAVRRGRRYIGIDLDASYLDLTLRRMPLEDPCKAVSTGSSTASKTETP